MSVPLYTSPLYTVEQRGMPYGSFTTLREAIVVAIHLARFMTVRQTVDVRFPDGKIWYRSYGRDQGSKLPSLTSSDSGSLPFLSFAFVNNCPGTPSTCT